MWIILVLTAIYLLFLAFLITGWRIIQVFPDKHKHNAFVSVVIPVRNEGRNLSGLLDDLEAQDYPSDYFEVIFVNDHSEDDTAEIIKKRKLITSVDLSVYDLPDINISEESPKKRAITFGIERARGDLILLTDGDCRMGQGWINSHINYFSNTKLQLLAGPVWLEKSGNFIQQVLCIEFSSLIGAGAATIGLNCPTICNGANLAFRKSAFFQVGGYRDNKHRISGDDEFLLRKVHDRFPESIGFLKSVRGLVITSYPENLKTFFLQRKRWAGKWKYHKNVYNSLLALFIFSFHLSLIVAILLALTGYISPYFILIIFILKTGMEFIFLRNVFGFINRRMNVFAFLLSSIFYSVYAVIFGIAANFGKFKWKGRSYKI